MREYFTHYIRAAAILLLEDANGSDASNASLSDVMMQMRREWNFA